MPYCRKIGQLTKEAQEAKNKDFKFIREFHSRKYLRSAKNEDWLNYTILFSDPVMSQNYQKIIRRKKVILIKIMLKLLNEPDLKMESVTDDEDFENEDID